MSERGPIDQDRMRDIWRALTDGLPVVVTTHQRADGDAVGSVLALFHALKGAGANCFALFEPPVPPMLTFLPGAESRVESLQPLPETYQLAVLDAGDFERIGAWHGQLSEAARTICLDHHASTDDFGDLFLVCPEASSTGELVYELLVAAGARITPEIAECLFTAIVTDTGQFAFENTTAECMSACAEFLRIGVDPAVLADRLFHSQTEAQVRLRHLAGATLQRSCGGRIAIMHITADMFAETGLHPIHTDRFANMPLHIDGVLAGVLLKEMPGEGYIKVSLRSRPPVDVCAVARHFGGGGHVRAAGCQIDGTLENARRAVTEQLRRQIAGPGGA